MPPPLYTHGMPLVHVQASINKNKIESMNGDISLYVAICAGICTSASLLPQLIKILREKKSEDLSFGMLITLLIGVSGWIVYGIMKEDYPIILTNSFSFIVNSLMIGFAWKYRRQQPQMA